MRGFDVTLNEPRLAELFRDVAACYWRSHGSGRSYARYIGTWCLTQLRPPRFVPSRKEGPGGEYIHHRSMSNGPIVLTLLDRFTGVSTILCTLVRQMRLYHSTRISVN